MFHKNVIENIDFQTIFIGVNHTKSRIPDGFVKCSQDGRSNPERGWQDYGERVNKIKELLRRIAEKMPEIKELMHQLNLL
jgi:hypothetical protein